MSFARSCSEQGSATAPSRHAPSSENTHSARAPIIVVDDVARARRRAAARPPAPAPPARATSANV